MYDSVKRWVPPSESAPEALVYEVEVLDVVTPPQVAKTAVPPQSAAPK
ncbi:MAG TPA: hypothetical protein VLM79_36170 [Kofleriaceae bacterium]|nr:hypothetical protein [Kofleriaceae bacterium]